MVHSRLCRSVRFRLCLWLPTGCMAIWIGRSGLGRYSRSPLANEDDECASSLTVSGLRHPRRHVDADPACLFWAATRALIPGVALDLGMNSRPSWSSPRMGVAAIAASRSSIHRLIPREARRSRPDRANSHAKARSQGGRSGPHARATSQSSSPTTSRRRRRSPSA